jgi:hypothetical protein
MSKSFTGSGRIYDTKSVVALNEMLLNLYFEVYATIGELPLVISLPENFYKKITGAWHIRALLPGPIPALVPTSEESISFLLNSGDEVSFPAVEKGFGSRLCTTSIPGMADELETYDPDNITIEDDIYY